MNRCTLKFLFASCVALTAAAAVADVSIDKLIDEAGLSEGPVAARDFEGWRPPKKIVLPDVSELSGQLQSAFPGVEFVVVQSEAEAIEEAADADALIVYCSDELVAAAERLVWIQIFSSGSEWCLDVDAVRNGEVMLTNMQKMSSPVIGEHAIAMMLSLTRGLVPFAKNMPDGNWDRSKVQDYGVVSVSDKTVLVVGLGGIGTAAARRAAALGMRVLATRNSSRTGPEFVDYVGLSDELFELAAQADVVINAAPLTPQTQGLFDREFFDAVKPGAIFINVARGGSVVSDDLVAALNDGRIAGAGLDVTDPEPLPPGHPLWQMDNVIITPHMAGFGSDRERHAALALENIRRFIAGDALLNVVDPALGY